MEITPSPHRPATTPWGRLLLLVAVIAPVSVLVLLPSGLGLQRYVVGGSSMAGDRPDSIGRGSLVLERLVPVDDLRPGDVITFRPPAGTGGSGTVTHRIVSVHVDGIRTQGDAEPDPDPWLLRPTGPVVPRVVWTVPVVGYAYLALDDWRFWAAVAVLVVGGLVVAAGTGGRRGRPRGSRGSRRSPLSRRSRPSPERRTAGSAGPLDVGRVTATAGAGPLDGAIGVD